MSGNNVYNNNNNTSFINVNSKENLNNEINQ